VLAGRFGAAGGAAAMVAVDGAMLLVVLRGVQRHLVTGSELAESLRGWGRALARRSAGRQALP
jgi:hypothetical protein